MNSPEKDQITHSLLKLGEDAARGRDSAEELLPLVYDELRRIAARFLAGERRDHTLQPTALVHEAYLKLVDQTRIDWKGRTHFLAIGASAMRRLLIDHARGRGRIKRGGEWERVSVDGALDLIGRNEVDFEILIALGEALERLETLDPRQARVVELRLFAGMKPDEVAELVGVSRRSVESDWTHGRAWLKAELTRKP